MDKSTLYAIIIAVVIIAILIALLFFKNIISRAIVPPTPSPPPTTVPPTPTSSPTPTPPSSPFTIPPSSTPPSSTPPTGTYIVDYNLLNTLSLQQALSVANALNNYLNSGVVGYVIWNGEYDGHVTVVFSSQSTYIQLTSQIQNTINKVVSYSPAVYNIDYSSPGSCSNVPQVIQQLVASGFTPSILATGGACQGIATPPPSSPITTPPPTTSPTPTTTPPPPSSTPPSTSSCSFEVPAGFSLPLGNPCSAYCNSQPLWSTQFYTTLVNQCSYTVKVVIYYESPPCPPGSSVSYTYALVGDVPANSSVQVPNNSQWSVFMYAYDPNGNIINSGILISPGPYILCSSS